jgi:hypothetical protein
MGSIIKVDNVGQKAFLSSNRENFTSFLEHSNSDRGGSGSLSFLEKLGIMVAAKLVEEKSSEWSTSGKSLKKQVITNNK